MGWNSKLLSAYYCLPEVRIFVATDFAVVKEYGKARGFWIMEDLGRLDTEESWE